MKIKSRRQREIEYAKEFSNISDDIYERLVNKLGDKFNENLINMVNYRINEIKDNVEYKSIKIVFYEEPIQTNRPRTNYHTHTTYVPNAKENHDAIENFIKKVASDIKLISVPMNISIDAYLKMPENISPLEMVMYETKNDYAAIKPDHDNIMKAYCDMLINNIILDDDIISSSNFNKYFSLKPRVEITITYTNGFASEYTYQKITSRKSYKENKDMIDANLLVSRYKDIKRRKDLST